MNLQSNILTVSEQQCMLGEGPVWDADNEKIFWIDITEGMIHQYSLRENAHQLFNAGEMVGSIALREKGGLVAGLQHGFAFIDLEEQSVEHIRDPEKGVQNRFNDGKCDAAGRFWAGTMAISEEESKGNLYVLETNLLVKKKIENVSISNGIAWSADNAVMYYINTPTNYVFAFDYDIEQGNINNQRVVIDLTHENGYADGMSIDEEGMLWIAFYGGWRIARYEPRTGKLLQQIELPAANVTSCTFGGNELRDLYITTARKGLNEKELESQPLAGSLFVLPDCGYKGTVAQKFKG